MEGTLGRFKITVCIDIQGYTRSRMAHDVLQALDIKHRLLSIGTECMAQHMWRNRR